MFTAINRNNQSAADVDVNNQKKIDQVEKFKYPDCFVALIQKQKLDEYVDMLVLILRKRKGY